MSIKYVNSVCSSFRLEGLEGHSEIAQGLSSSECDTENRRATVELFLVCFGTSTYNVFKSCTVEESKTTAKEQKQV